MIPQNTSLYEIDKDPKKKRKKQRKRGEVNLQDSKSAPIVREEKVKEEKFGTHCEESKNFYKR